LFTCPGRDLAGFLGVAHAAARPGGGRGRRGGHGELAVPSAPSTQLRVGSCAPGARAPAVVRAGRSDVQRIPPQELDAMGRGTRDRG